MELLACALWVVVGRRGRCGDGPVAVRRRRLLLLLLRAVLMSPRNGVVGGRSVLKERLAVHHLTRRSVSLAYLLFCRAPKVNKTGVKNENNFDYLTIVKQNAVGCRLRLSSGNNQENSLRKSETSSLSMRQLCLNRRNNPKSQCPPLQQEWSELLWKRLT